MSLLGSPYGRTMGFAAERDAEGRLRLVMAWDANKGGRPGFFHGGAIAGLLEAAAYATLADALDDADRPVIKPINVTVSFMRGAREKPLYAHATIERLGRRIANVEAVAWQDDPATPIAIAQMNIMLERRAPAQPS
jgi:uncharacterized protein (TIGR00369 family)